MALSLKHPETDRSPRLVVIDSSALPAILLDEPERTTFVARIDADETRRASAAALLEPSMVVLERLGEAGLAELDTLLRIAGVEIAPFAPEQLTLAVDAFRRFGKGRHAVGHSFSEGLSYALAKATGEPLLFKGEDFSQTEIRQAL